jgi:hypothetical protein
LWNNLSNSIWNDFNHIGGIYIMLVDFVVYVVHVSLSKFYPIKFSLVRFLMKQSISHTLTFGLIPQDSFVSFLFII